MSFRQSLNIFFQRVSRFWKVLAVSALIVGVALFFNAIFGFFELFGIEVSSDIQWDITVIVPLVFMAIYMRDMLDFKKPIQPFKLHQLVLPKKFYSLKVLITEAPDTAVFILLLVLWLILYGWYYWQFGPLAASHKAFLGLLFLGAFYVFCVLAQGYRDFFNDETVFEDKA